MARSGTTWQPGQSGNPAGRPPRGDTLTDALRDLLGPTHRRKLAKRLLDLAHSDDESVALAALKYIYDRVDGRPAETVHQEVTGKDGGPVEHIDYSALRAAELAYARACGYEPTGVGAGERADHPPDQGAHPV